MKPSPPNWTPEMIAISPTVDQCVGVSTTVSPVTQTADVAVNNACRKVVDAPSSCATGSISTTVSTAIADAKPTISTIPGRRSCAEASPPSPRRRTAPSCFATPDAGE